MGITSSISERVTGKRRRLRAAQAHIQDASTAPQDLTSNRNTPHTIPEGDTQPTHPQNDSPLSLPELRALSCRLRPGAADLVPLPDFVQAYKTVYLTQGTSPTTVCNAVAILTLQIPITARVYSSEGALLDLSARSLPADKFAASHALVSEARIVGAPADVTRGVEGYMAGTLRMQSAFQVHNHSTFYYEVGEWVEEVQAGMGGRNGCVQGIYGFASLPDAFDWTVKMYETTPGFATKVSAAIQDAPDRVDMWYRWNDVWSLKDTSAKPTDRVDNPVSGSGMGEGSGMGGSGSGSGVGGGSGSGVEESKGGGGEEEEEEVPLLGDHDHTASASLPSASSPSAPLASAPPLPAHDATTTTCLACTRPLPGADTHPPNIAPNITPNITHNNTRFKPCGHGPFCGKCRSKHLGAACPLCATVVVRADGWRRWSRPVCAQEYLPVPRLSGVAVA